MSYRCTDPFIFADQVFPGGLQVDDDHPILKSHSANFAKVDEPVVRTETASAAPGEARAVAPAKKAPAKKVAAKNDKPEGDN